MKYKASFNGEELVSNCALDLMQQIARIMARKFPKEGVIYTAETPTSVTILIGRPGSYISIGRIHTND